MPIRLPHFEPAPHQPAATASAEKYPPAFRTRQPLQRENPLDGVGRAAGFTLGDRVVRFRLDDASR
jgi:hypothetical protein